MCRPSYQVHFYICRARSSLKQLREKLYKAIFWFGLIRYKICDYTARRKILQFTSTNKWWISASWNLMTALFAHGRLMLPVSNMIPGDFRPSINKYGGFLHHSMPTEPSGKTRQKELLLHPRIKMLLWMRPSCHSDRASPARGCVHTATQQVSQANEVNGNGFSRPLENPVHPN